MDILHNFTVAKKRTIKKSGGKRGPYGPEDQEKLGTDGIHLRQWRLFRGMTIAALAEAADVANGTITGIESGDVGWTSSMLSKLAIALDTTTAALLGVNPLKGSEQFLSLWDRADKAQRQRIDDYAQGVVGPPTEGEKS